MDKLSGRLRRDLSVWLRRARECRNPFMLAWALDYERQRFRLLRLATGGASAQLRSLLREIEDDIDFIGEVRRRLSAHTAYAPRAVDFMLFGRYGSVFFNEVTLYTIIRALRPEIVVETGGTPGKSTAFILRAMQANDTGHLYTIDLPPPAMEAEVLVDREQYHAKMPRGAESGWIVPEGLKDRHTLLLGSSQEHLPPLLERLPRVDIFLHDSDHSYTNMMWEFETAWPSLGDEGLLLSDDLTDNPSFFDFCRQHNLLYARVFNLGAARRRNGSTPH